MIHRIFGPPGTGKTTTLLRLVDEAVEQGFPLESICFLAFTRKAANEAKERACAKFKVSAAKLPWFRTIHSLAFQHLGLTRQEVMGFRDYIAIAQALGLFITMKGIQEDGTVLGLSKGDRLFFMEQMARARMIPLEEYWSQYPDEDIDLYELQRVADSVYSYKVDNNKIDFIDMLYHFIDPEKTNSFPQISHLIVDEAQDLSPLQWEVIDSLIRLGQPKEVYIAGDDDQAIFTWAGADVRKFIHLSGGQEVLQQSYRCPSVVHSTAMTIASRIRTRVNKVYKPAGHEGSVNYVNGFEEVDLSEGTWLLLARNVYLLERLKEHCHREGFIYDSPMGSPTKGPVLRAIITWENLRKGKEEPVSSISEVYELISTRLGVGYGYKKILENTPDETRLNIQQLKESYGLLTEAIWHEALDKIPDIDRTYFLAALRRGEKLLKEPRIKLSTIHGVKGGEADNVLLLTDMAGRTYQEYQQNPDDEHRVWYVAVTRTRKNLFIVQPSTNLFYQV